MPQQYREPRFNPETGESLGNAAAYGPPPPVPDGFTLCPNRMCGVRVRPAGGTFCGWCGSRLNSDARNISSAGDSQADAQSALRARLLAELRTVPESELSRRFERDITTATMTSSGLMYVVRKEGHGEQPRPEDRIRLGYTGWLLDGTEIEKGVNRLLTLRFQLQSWREGVGMMRIGEKRTLIVPPELGYGASGSGRIPPNAMLVYDVELWSIEKESEPSPTASQSAIDLPLVERPSRSEPTTATGSGEIGTLGKTQIGIGVIALINIITGC